MPAEQIDAMVGMAQAQGFVQQEAEHLTSAVRLEGGCRHTAAMHSKDLDNLDYMANAINTSIFNPEFHSINHSNSHILIIEIKFSNICPFKWGNWFICDAVNNIPLGIII